MEMETVQAFLASPNLPDIIAYVLGAIILIYQVFAKLGIKKNNAFTVMKISTDTSKLNAMRAELNRDKHELVELKNQFLQEKAELVDKCDKLETELEEMRKAIRLMARNSEELVVSGLANEVNRMLPTISAEETSTNINEIKEDIVND